MNDKKKILKLITYVVIILAAIFILFYWYSAQNSKRIKTQ